MTQIIGVDGATANTGLALWRDGRWSVKTVHTTPDMTPEMRWRAIGAPLWHMVDDDTLVVLEGVFAGAKMLGTALDLAMLHGTLRIGLSYRQIPFAIVDVMAVKQYAVGVGKATPREMIAATSRMRLGFEVGDDHQADAAFLVAMAHHHYGAPICDTFPAGYKAMARVKWPQWHRLPVADDPGQSPGWDLNPYEKSARGGPARVPSPFAIGQS